MDEPVNPQELLKAVMTREKRTFVGVADVGNQKGFYRILERSEPVVRPEEAAAASAAPIENPMDAPVQPRAKARSKSPPARSRSLLFVKVIADDIGVYCDVIKTKTFSPERIHMDDYHAIQTTLEQERHESCYVIYYSASQKRSRFISCVYFSPEYCQHMCRRGG